MKPKQLAGPAMTLGKRRYPAAANIKPRHLDGANVDGLGGRAGQFQQGDRSTRSGERVKPKHPARTPMTLGNMRGMGVQGFVAS